MIRNFIKHIILTISIIITLCFCLGLSAQWISPSSIALPTYFVMLMPLWTILMFINTIFWLCFKKWVYSLILIAIIACTFEQWRNVIVINKPTKYDNKTITILTFNTHIFNNHQDKDFDKIAQFIKATDADIVCLQEFGYFHRYGTSKQDILKFFDSIYPHRHIWFKNQNKWGENGLATFSRFPIIKKKKIEYPSADNISIFSDIIIDNDTIRVINNHLESNKFNKEDRLFAEKLIDDSNNKRDLLDAGRKIGSRLITGAINRSQQAEAVRYCIDETNYPTIALGDFNDVPLSYTYHKIGENLQNALSKAGPWGYNWTYNQNIMLVPIDHILVDKKFNISKCTIHKEMKISDHYPISCKLQIR